MVGDLFQKAIRNRAVWFLVSVSVVSGLLHAPVSGAPDQWREFNSKGKQAYEEGRLAEAEQWFEKALEEAEASGRPTGRLVTSLNNLAALYASEGRYEDAELQYQRSLALLEELQGPEHPDLLLGLNNLMSLYLAQGQYGKAEPLARRSLGILEQALGADHPHLVPLINTLGELAQIQGNYSEAEGFYKRALVIEERSLGPDHPELAHTLDRYAKLLRATGRHEEAASVEAKIERIRESSGKDAGSAHDSGEKTNEHSDVPNE